MGSAAILQEMQREADLALCRSALYEALALGFRPPTDETVARLASAEGAAALADATAMLGEADGADVAGRVGRLGASSGPVSPAALVADYRRLFGHTVRALVPPYETEYGDDSVFLPAQEMSDLAAFLRAFGLTVRPDGHERIDHVSCELEFLMFLTRKEAFAFERGDDEMLAGTRGAARSFLRDHLGRFAPALGNRLAREDAGGFYGTLGEVLAAFVAGECRRAGVPAGPEFLRLRSTSDGNAPMACGTGTEEPELLQIQGLSSPPGQA